MVQILSPTTKAITARPSAINDEVEFNNWVILNSIRWETYQALLDDLGEENHAHLAYSDGFLEIMTPLSDHESDNRFIECLLGVMADEFNINLKRFGSFTFRKKSLEKGAEPDSCYYIQNEPFVRNIKKLDLNTNPPPDLVLEIDRSNSSLNKFPIYAAFAVPEVWRYTGSYLEVFILVENEYQACSQSLAFPLLDLSVVPYYLWRSLEIGETGTLKEFKQYINQIVDKNNSE